MSPELIDQVLKDIGLEHIDDSPRQDSNSASSSGTSEQKQC